MASAPASATATISTSPPSDDGPVRPDGAREHSSTSVQKPSTPAGTATRDISEANETASIQTTDGRVKNPVPSKLKGKADNKNGNFGVMHIDINSSQAALRNAAAKRTSEETEAAARLANMRGYQSIKRSKLAWNPQPESDTRISFTAPMTPQNGPYTPAAHHIGPPPHDTKAEQARLLTLLRSLHPVVVVDQLCKALAYFGGIPGAPPSNGGLFPESARNNGQGSVFVGWIGEIFPPIEGNPAAIAPHPALEHLPPSTATNTNAITTAVTPTSTPASAFAPSSAPAQASGNNTNATSTPTASFKRPRGRPKGSKSSKPRKDKGVRKSIGGLSSSNQADSIDESNSALLNISNLTQVEFSQGSQLQEPLSVLEQSQNLPPTSSSHSEVATQFEPDSSMMSTPGTARKRGRPKGSKNRPKNASESGQGTPDITHVPPPSSANSNQTSRSPLIQKSAPGQAIQAPRRKTTHARTEQQQLSPTIQRNTLEQAKSIGMRQPPVSEPTTVTGTENWAAPVTQSHESNQQGTNPGSQPLPRKRKAGEATQGGDSASVITSTDVSPRIQYYEKTPTHNTTTENMTNMKRPRVSRETHQNPSFNSMESHSPQLGMATLPVMNNNFSNVSQSLSSGNFDNQISGNSRKSTNQPFQQHQQQTHNLQQQSPPQTHSQPSQNHQQQNQPFSPRKIQQQTQGMRMKPQHQQGNMPSSRNQAPSVYSAPQMNMGSQAYYTHQRQMSGQLGQVGNPSGGFSQSRSGQSSQFSSTMARQGTSNDNVVNMVQQGAVAGARSQQGQAASRQTSGYSNQQVSSSSASASNMSQFQSFGEHSYIGMDYGLNDRDVQDVTAAAFGDSSQLEAALAEPNIREQLYQAMSHR